ncbi:hypothetical protein ACTI_70730 [Actinoplanes sp. OR16]|uniref:HoxN/HupN/NixA family nickel/cobalt transporter n=1 Tax=Actinoplanes sp. OR16 TaxID=946334 RepID=UPI000F6DF7E3|nr:hypothetical protein [Actinoplanes sp. OR16]BBH70388.1 hypothetical protein ACTI_70730 [Actinoplanes sp. OR16]
MKKLVVVAAGVFASFPATPASAHSLDEVIQQVYLTPAAATLDVQVDIVAGALVAPGFARSLDTDGDRRLSASETSAHDARVEAALALATDGAPAELAVTASTYPPFDLLSAGGGVITIRASAPLPESTGAFAITDRYLTEQKTRIQMSVLVAKNAGRAASSIRRGHEGRAIAVGLAPSAVARNAVAGPDAAGAGAAGEGAAGDGDGVAAAAGSGGAMLDALRAPVESPMALVLLIGVCALLGAFHALTPGHGKAMLAAYLVGSRGTPRQAVALGGIVTVTHTGSVLLLGAAVLAAGHYVMRSLLVPGLQVVTGVVVLFLGLRILRRRLRGSGRHASAAHTHTHTHAPSHSHAVGGFHRPGRAAWGHAASGQVCAGSGHGQDDDAAGRREPEAQEEYEDFAWERESWHGTAGAGRSAYMVEEREKTAPVSVGSRRELAAMGAAGGLIPCPEALGVLILAVGLHRTALGLAMIVAFSAGLGAVLVGLGLILVTARDRFTDVRPGPLLRRLPVVSAAIVVVLGLAMTVTGVAAAL